jgi:hypothetical protein
VSEHECTEHLLDEIERLREANFELREGELRQRIKQLEAVVNDPEALWTNWLRGDVKLPAGIGDVRQYQDRIKRLEEAGDALFELCDASPIQFELVDQIQQRLKAWEEAKEAKP